MSRAWPISSTAALAVGSMIYHVTYPPAQHSTGDGELELELGHGRFSWTRLVKASTTCRKPALFWLDLQTVPPFLYLSPPPKHHPPPSPLDLPPQNPPSPPPSSYVHSDSRVSPPATNPGFFILPMPSSTRLSRGPKTTPSSFLPCRVDFHTREALFPVLMLLFSWRAKQSSHLVSPWHMQPRSRSPPGYRPF